jgi:hypothetical protein
MDNGILAEYRIVRLIIHSNYFARRSIPLRNYLYPDRLDITDIDVLGIRYNIDFTTTKIMVDCKSGLSGRSSDSKPANRILWLSGLKNFLNYDLAYFYKPNINPVMKDFALRNEVVPIDETKLNELEARMGLVDVWQGSYNLKMDNVMMEYYNSIKNIANLKNLYWFLRIEFWTLPCNLQLKRCMNYIERLFNEIHLSKYERYLLIELYILTTVALLNICRDTYPYTNYERELWITNKMIEGLGTIDQQGKILSLMKMICETKIEEVTGQKVPICIDGYRNQPPDYTEDLISLIGRLMDKAEYSVELPRFLDFFMFEYVFFDKDINKLYLNSFFNRDLDILAKLAKNIIKFLDPLSESREMNRKLFDY